MRHPAIARATPRLYAVALGIVFAAVALRALPVFLHRLEADRIATVDSERYLELADRLAAGDGFRLPGATSPELESELFRTPGYPAVLAIAGALPGSRDAWVLGLMILAAATTVAMCFVLVSAWASPRAGLVAAALLALDPAHVVYSNLLMADVLCGASIATALVLLERARGSSATNARWWVAGCLLSVATALRPVAVLLVVPAAIYLLHRDRRRAGVVAFVAAALLFPFGWTLRNGLVTGSWTLSTAFDVNLALVAAARVEARVERVPRSLGEARVMARVAAIERASGLAFHRACRQVGLETLSAAPRAALAEASLSVFEMLLAGERRYLLQVFGLASDQERQGGRTGSPWLDLAGYSRFERLVIACQGAFMVCVWVLATAGFVALWRRGRADVALLVLCAIAVVLAPSLVVGTGRMRLPVAALIHGLAGIGVAAFVWRAEFRRSVAG